MKQIHPPTEEIKLIIAEKGKKERKRDRKKGTVSLDGVGVFYPFGHEPGSTQDLCQAGRRERGEEGGDWTLVIPGNHPEEQHSPTEVSCCFSPVLPATEGSFVQGKGGHSSTHPLLEIPLKVLSSGERGGQDTRRQADPD